MKAETYTHAQIDAQAARRPSGYREEIMACAVHADAHGVTFDVERPEWAQLMRKYRAPAPVPPMPRRLPPNPLDPVPEAQWPLAVKAMALVRKEGEAGVGDTVKRLLGHLGGDAIATFYKKATGRDCGCSDRQRRLNLLFPYAVALSPHR